MRRRSVWALGLVVVALLAVACGAVVLGPVAYGRTSGQAPTIEILSPAEGATLPAGNVAVAVRVANFNLVDKIGQDGGTGEGHIHYFVDVDAPVAQDRPAITGAGTFMASASTSHTWRHLAPGQRTLSVELVNSDRTPLEKPVVAKVTVNVAGE